MKPIVTLQEYWDMLNSHDWYYEMSDDGRVCQRGRAAENKLLDISKGNPEYWGLYLGFEAHHFTGKPWNTEKQPKPRRPE